MNNTHDIVADAANIPSISNDAHCYGLLTPSTRRLASDFNTILEPEQQNAANMLPHDNINMFQLNSNENSNEIEESKDLHAKHSLGYHYHMNVSVFWGLMMLSTIALLIWSNNSDGAFVSVQVTPILPSYMSNMLPVQNQYSLNIKETMTPWQFSLFSYEPTNTITTDEQLFIDTYGNTSEQQVGNMMQEILVKLDNFQTHYPSFELSSLIDDDVDNFDNNTNDLLLYYQYYLLPESQFQLESEYAKQKTIKLKVFSFTLASSISDFWQSEAYELAFVIALFSGAWPYVKIIILLYILTQPIAHSKRGVLLVVLDQLGKYSFIDLFVMVFMCVSFFLTISEQIPEGGILIAIIVEIDIGVTTFAIVTLVSMIYSMSFLFLNEQVYTKVLTYDLAHTKLLLAKLAFFCDHIYPQQITSPHAHALNFGVIVEEEEDDQMDNNYIEFVDNDNALLAEDINININTKTKKNKNWLSRIQKLTLFDYDKFRALTTRRKSSTAKNEQDLLQQQQQQISEQTRLDELDEIKSIAHWHETYIIEHDGFVVQKGSVIYNWKKSVSSRCWMLLDLEFDSVLELVLRCLFLTVMLINIYLCLVVIYTAPVRYNILGIAGWAISDNVLTSSIIDTVDLLPGSTDMKFAAHFCQVQYYATVVVFPVLTSIFVAAMWFVPMTYKMHRFLLKLLFPVQAWVALDVFVVAVVAASLELNAVSKWILNTNFKAICGPGGIIENTFHTGCFSVKGTVTYGTYMILVWVVVEWCSLLYTISHMERVYAKLAGSSEVAVAGVIVRHEYEEHTITTQVVNNNGYVVISQDEGDGDDVQ